MKKIDLNECHKLLLGIAKEFDRICTKHSIPYYMLGGTMLGAIRHKGFIPWDDDMDFGVPREHYDKLIGILEIELPERYKCYTYNNCNYIKYPYLKITDRNTYMYDSREKSIDDMQIGVNVDIFPLDKCDPDDKNIKSIYRWIKINQMVYTKPINGGITKKIIKRLLRYIFPLNKNQIAAIIDKKITSLHQGEYIGNLLGRWREREIIPQEWYGESCKYIFEDIQLNGFKDYDLYLKKLYKNYMELPPESKRFTHSEEIFYR